MQWSLVLLLVALAVVPLGVVAIIKDQPYAGTFSYTVPPGQYIYLPIHVTNGGRVSGNFNENQSQLITVYLFNQQQFDQYQANSSPPGLFSTTDQSRGTYAASIPAPGTYYVVTVHGTGYVRTAEQVTLTVRVDGTNLPYLGLESLAPIGAGSVVVAYVLQRRRNIRTISSLLQKNPNFGPGHGEYDDQILSITRDLCQQLRFQFNPITVYWIAWMKWAGIRAAPSDLCLLGVKGPRRGYVHLPAALRGRLEPGEWRPLIASSLIGNFRPELRRRRAAVNRIWRLTILAVIILTAAILSFINSLISMNNPFELFTSYPLYAIGASVAFFLIVFTARKVNMILRKYFLEADRLAAEIVGKTQIIQALQKIDSMKLGDLEERKSEKNTIWRRGGVLPWPGITQRIRNLEIV